MGLPSRRGMERPFRSPSSTSIPPRPPVDISQGSSHGTGILTTGQSVGDRDFSVELNADGLWATFGFIKGDKAVQLQTVGSGPLTDLDGLKELARIVERRL